MGRKSTIDINKKYGHLIILKQIDDYVTPSTGFHTARFLCKCDCGREFAVRGSHLTDGSITQCRSCGLTKHGLSHSPIYKSYKSMISRCYNTKDANYSRYGGRGITVTSDWYNSENPNDVSKIQNFNDWAMKNGWASNLTLDRIDPNGNYEPNNCRWGDQTLQANNRRDNLYISYNDDIQTAADWDRARGFPNGTVAARISRGWTEEQALNSTHPKAKKKLINAIYFKDKNGRPIEDKGEE